VDSGGECNREMQPPVTADDAAQENTVNSEVQNMPVEKCREMQQPCGVEKGGQVVELQLRKFVSWYSQMAV